MPRNPRATSRTRSSARDFSTLTVGRQAAEARAVIAAFRSLIGRRSPIRAELRSAVWARIITFSTSIAQNLLRRPSTKSQGWLDRRSGSSQTAVLLHSRARHTARRRRQLAAARCVDSSLAARPPRFSRRLHSCRLLAVVVAGAAACDRCMAQIGRVRVPMDNTRSAGRSKRKR